MQRFRLPTTFEYAPHAWTLAVCWQRFQGASLISGKPPCYIDLQAEDDMDRRVGFLLGSAALPFWGKAQEVGRTAYADASFGGMNTAPGAVPIQPLRQQAETLGLDAIVVVHTATGVNWSAGSRSEKPIVELRPSGIEDHVGFWSAKSEGVTTMFRAGAHDARRRVEELVDAVSGWRAHGTAAEDLAAVRGLLDD